MHALGVRPWCTAAGGRTHSDSEVDEGFEVLIYSSTSVYAQGLVVGR